MKKEVVNLMIILVIYSIFTISVLIFLATPSENLHERIHKISFPIVEPKIPWNSSEVSFSHSVASVEDPVPVANAINQPNPTTLPDAILIPDPTSLNIFEDSDLSSSIKLKQEVPYKKVPKSSCNIHDFSLTAEEYKIIFNFQDYKQCKTAENDEILIEDNTIVAHCVDSQPSYSVDPGLPQRLGGKFKEEVTWTTSGKIGPRSEYAFIKCKETFYSLFFLQMNRKAADRANQIRISKNHDDKPMNVLVLVLDSVSRFTTYKFLPKMTEYLSDRKNYQYEDYSTYEFIRFGIPAVFTLPNMIQVLYGEDVETAKKTIKIERPDIELDSPEHLEYQKKKSLWNYFMDLGYVSLFLKDTVHDYLNKFLGREITADHVFENFWRAAWTVYGFNDFSSRQRCYGMQNSHNLTFGYAFEFFDKYQNTNKFAYVHLDAGHEATGNIQTVDEDITSFLMRLTQLFKRKKESFAVYFMSDHGYKFEKLAFDERGFIERNSPFAYLMISKDVEDKINARENLVHNSQMLTGRFDANLMLKYLAHAPYTLPTSFDLKELKKQYPVTNVVNLLTEKASQYRTCRDLGVPEVFCICSWYKRINPNHVEEIPIIQAFFSLIQEYFKEMSKRSGCKTLNKLEFIQGKKFKVNDYDNGNITFYEIELAINNRAHINAKFNYCLGDKLRQGMVKSNKKEHPYSRTRLGKEMVFIQLKQLDIMKSCPNFECIC